MSGLAAEIGRLAVWVAVLAGMGAAAAGLRGRSGARALLGVAAGACLVGTAVLVRALVDNDFSYAYVADVSRRHATAPYRVAALWGGMAGSLLWFSTLVGVVGWVAAGRVSGVTPRPRAAAGRARDGRSDDSGDGDETGIEATAAVRSAQVNRIGAVPAIAAEALGSVRGVVVAVPGLLVAALAGLVLLFADPFERLDLPAIEGAGLTPILEHPAMLYHPPLLYLGLASLVAAFALAVAALAGAATGAELGEQLRRWLLVPWTVLAVGMVAGAHWAYVELGWGGYWAWDPVENTALLPFLAVTLALHAALLGPAPAAGTRADGADAARPAASARRPGAVGWGTGALVCVAFLLALTGTMLTRSGAVSSVHAFGEDAAIGRAMAALVGVAAVAVGWLLWRARTAAPPLAGRPGVDLPSTTSEALVAGSDDGPLSAADVGSSTRWLVLGHLAVVGTVLAITVVGTLAPLVSELAGGDDLAIEGHYFAAFAGPLATVGLALVAMVPLRPHLATLGRAVATVLRPPDAAAADCESLLAASDRRPPLLARSVTRIARAMPAGWDGSGHRTGAVGAPSPTTSVVTLVGGLALGVGALVLGGGELDPGRLALGSVAGAALVSSAAALARSVTRIGRVMPAGRDDSGHRTGMAAHLAHAGVGLLLLGVAGTATGATERVAVRPGDTVEILGVTIEYRGLRVDEEPDGAGAQAVVADVRAAGHDLTPALVAYPERQQLLAETSLVSTPLRDVQVALRDARDSGAAVLEVGVHPLQVWVWWGALTIVLSGALAATRTVRRRRTPPVEVTVAEGPDPARSPQPTDTPPSPATPRQLR